MSSKSKLKKIMYVLNESTLLSRRPYSKQKKKYCCQKDQILNSRGDTRKEGQKTSRRYRVKESDTKKSSARGTKVCL